MNGSLAEVRYTANFELNLQSIERFWIENGRIQGYDRLLDELIDTVLVNLERHPRMGRPFMLRQPDSVEASNRLKRLQSRMTLHTRTAEIREYILSDYVLLYAVLGLANQDPGLVYLVSIRHYKQLSFDLARFF